MKAQAKKTRDPVPMMQFRKCYRQLFKFLLATRIHHLLIEIEVFQMMNSQFKLLYFYSKCLYRSRLGTDVFLQPSRIAYRAIGLWLSQPNVTISFAILGCHKSGMNVGQSLLVRLCSTFLFRIYSIYDIPQARHVDQAQL